MSAIKVLIVDDSQIHLEGLKLILRTYNHICFGGEANNPKEAIDCIEQEMPSIAILDISLESDMDGIELAKTIKNKYPTIKIIFLTHYKGAKYLINALKAGACAYLPKDVEPAELFHAITAVSEGKGVYLGDTVPLNVVLDVVGSEESKVKNKLTYREIEIIELLAQGFSTKEIAQKLGVESNTIESHKERIKEKLNVKTVIQMVVIALKKGIISLEN